MLFIHLYLTLMQRKLGISIYCLILDVDKLMFDDVLLVLRSPNKTVITCFQIKMMPHGLDNLYTIDEATRRKTYEIAQKGGGGVDSKTEGGPDGSGDKKKRKWGVGDLDFEAVMRMLDNAVSCGFNQSSIYNLCKKIVF